MRQNLPATLWHWHPFWGRWLLFVSLGVIGFGFMMVVAPVLTLQGFGWLLYADPGTLQDLDPTVVAYISLLHAVLGAVLMGWGVALVIVVLGPFREGATVGWDLVAGSIVAWFIPDTSVSLVAGFWQNALLNFVFAVLFLFPLVATYQTFHAKKPESSS